MTYEQLRERLRSAGLKRRGASAAEIEEAELSLGVRFPDQYRRFLAEFGWGGVAHGELYGLGPDVPPHLDLVRATISERSEMAPAIPGHLLPVMNNGGGDHYCLDTSVVGEAPVVFWSHEEPADQEPWVEGE